MADPLRAFREMHGEEGGGLNASTPIVESWFENVGARPRVLSAGAADGERGRVGNPPSGLRD
jgi:hypothetical protein